MAMPMDFVETDEVEELKGLSAALSANSVTARLQQTELESANINLLVKALATVAKKNTELSKRLTATEARFDARCNAVEEKIESKTDVNLDAMREQLQSVAEQVENVVLALRVGHMARNNALSNQVREVLKKSLDERRSTAFSVLQKRWRFLRSKALLQADAQSRKEDIVVSKLTLSTSSELETEKSSETPVVTDATCRIPEKSTMVSLSSTSSELETSKSQVAIDVSHAINFENNEASTTAPREYSVIETDTSALGRDHSVANRKSQAETEGKQTPVPDAPEKIGTATISKEEFDIASKSNAIKDERPAAPQEPPADLSMSNVSKEDARGNTKSKKHESSNEEKAIPSAESPATTTVVNLAKEAKLKPQHQIQSTNKSLKTARILKRHEPTKSSNRNQVSVSELQNMLDDGETARKLVDLEQAIVQRLNALEKRCSELSRMTTKTVQASDTKVEELSENVQLLVESAAEVEKTVERAAECAARNIMDKYMVEKFGDTDGILEMRKEINAVTNFADDLQRQCEEAMSLSPNSSSVQPVHEETLEMDARTRVTCALYALRDAVAARRAVEKESLHSFFEITDSLARQALDQLEKDAITVSPDAILPLTTLASTLDAGLDSEAMQSTSFKAGAGHALVIASNCDGEKKKARTVEKEAAAAWANIETWGEAAVLSLRALLQFLDRHGSPSATAISLIRLRAELNDIPSITKQESRFSTHTSEHVATNYPWRLSEECSRLLRCATGVEPLCSSSELALKLTELDERLSTQGEDITSAHNAALAARRKVTSVEDIVQASVSQIQQDFASRADIQSVKSVLGQMSQKLRTTNNDLAQQRALGAEHAEELTRIANKVDSDNTPQFNRLEHLLATKASMSQVIDLQLKLEEAQSQAQENDPGGTITTSKCLACNRPFQHQHEVIQTPRSQYKGAAPTSSSSMESHTPSLAPPLASISPNARSSLMPPGGHASPMSIGPGVESARSPSAVNTTPVAPAVLPSVQPNKVHEAPAKKTLTLQFAGGTRDTDVVVARTSAGSSRLTPLSTKRPSNAVLQKKPSSPTSSLAAGTDTVHAKKAAVRSTASALYDD